MCVCVRDHMLKVCEPDVLQIAWVILPNVQSRCTSGEDEMIQFWGSRVSIMTRPNMVKITCSKMHLSSKSIPIDGLTSKTVRFKEYGTLKRN